MRDRLLPLLLLAAFALAASPASAHRLALFATVVGGSIEGKAYFAGGGPAGDVAVTLRDGSGAILAETRSDREGRFALEAPVKTDLAVVADAMDGHVARFAIPASRLPDSLPGGPDAAMEPRPDPLPPAAGNTGAADEERIAAIVARQIAPLGAQIDALESALRLRDVLGGIGYIAGLFGLLAFLKARRRGVKGGGA